MKTLRLPSIALSLAALSFMAFGCRGSADMEHLGGSWLIGYETPLPEPGGPVVVLYRDVHGRPQRVDHHLLKWHFYPPDCVMYETTRQAATNVVFAACGFRTPVAVADSGTWPWTLEQKGLRRELPPVVKEGKAVRTVERIPLDVVQALVERQPELRADWRVDAVLDFEAVPKETTEEPVDLDQREPNGMTALTRAAENGDVALVNALLAAGAAVNSEDNYGLTALMAAADRGPVELVESLVSAGADLNRQDNMGRTALMIAAAARRTDIATVLLQHGADATLRDRNNETAVDWARGSNDRELIQLLQNNGAPQR